MIVALFNQRAGVGKTTLAPHLAGDWARRSKRVTIDVNPEPRGRIKVVAFQRGTTVSEMLCELLDREVPVNEGAAR